jgi:hypothetical protein
MENLDCLDEITNRDLVESLDQTTKLLQSTPLSRIMFVMYNVTMRTLTHLGRVLKRIAFETHRLSAFCASYPKTLALGIWIYDCNM